ncbi:MAG: calcium-binding protein [Rhizobium sp.]|nr:calcium-binding protein [Rhizobium sp.]
MNLLSLFISGMVLPAVILLPPSAYGNAPFTLARVTCKQVSSCEEAVAIWCNGYSRADGDSDGIPCEAVCHSLKQVETIKLQQGC